MHSRPPTTRHNLVRKISRLLMTLNYDGGHLFYYFYSNFICVYIIDVRDPNIWKMKENGNIFTYINTLRLCKFVFEFNLFHKRIIHLFSCAPCYDTHFNLRSLFVLCNMFWKPHETKLYYVLKTETYKLLLVAFTAMTKQI